jgi:hypothetical protein|tara:strand:- start:111 stop:404 length:294 start_codon:yes stop_codon:yes gene_type:complete
LKIKQEVLKGFIIGVFSSIIGVFICTIILSNVKHKSIIQTFNLFKAEGHLWMLLSLGAILNLLVFFLFLKKDLDYRARGVLLATMLVAFISYGFYFL